MEVKGTEHVSYFKFLARISNILSSSLDFQEMYDSISKVCVPFLGDYCVIDIVDEEGIKRVSAYHVDKKYNSLIQELYKFAPRLKRSAGPAKVLSTGKVETVEKISDKWLDDLVQTKSQKEILHKLHPKSVIYIPLKVRKKTIGVLSIVSTKRVRHYSETDISLANDLSYRIGLALDNAQLYQEAQEEIQRRKEMENELTKSKDQLEVILQNIVDGITVQDKQGSIIFANDMAAKMIGYASSAELLKTPLSTVMDKFEMLCEDDTPFPLHQLPGRKVLSGESVARDVLKFKIKSTGEVRYAHVRAKAVLQSGSPAYAVNVFHDITERKEEERRTNYFIGFAGHELKSPLASMKAFIQLLRKRFSQHDDTQSLDYLSKVDAKINTLTKLINDYLDITKIRAGKLEFFDDVFDFDELLQEAVEDMQRSNPTHKINIEGKAKMLVKADRARLMQVLVNLIQNAIKYSPNATEVNIKINTKNKQVICSIQDFGIGIASDKLNQIFVPFSRVSDPAKGKFPGLGIGLYLAHEILKRYNGKITVESEEGKGSTFTFILPRNS